MHIIKRMTVNRLEKSKIALIAVGAAKGRAQVGVVVLVAGLDRFSSALGGGGETETFRDDPF